MAHVIFYEKPGCSGNARQKGVLIAAGHTLDVRDLLTARWTAATLRPFFGSRPVIEWFNPMAPAIRDREIDPAAFDESAALALMCAQPILIRRPLLQLGDDRRCGFDPAAIDGWIGLTDNADHARSELESCPKKAHALTCRSPP